VLTQLRNRGLRDILIPCCDGLTGLPEAITAVSPDTVVQTCVMHVIRNAMRFVETDFGEITDRMELARHGANTFWGLLTRTAATIAAHTLPRTCLTDPGAA
jgi:hypothetical protein